MLYRKIRFPHTVLILVTGLITCCFYCQVHAAVNLRYFRAVPQETKITIEWGTATEINHAGFYVLRSKSSNGDFQRLSQFIYAQGDSLTGADYQYEDLNVFTGETYWYKLESIDTNQRSTLSDPISVAFEVPTATPTPSVTPTNTPVWTPTPTIRIPATLSPTRTMQTTSVPLPALSPEPTVQVTEAPQNPSPNEIQETETSSSVTEEVSTKLLLPFPTITIQFPTKQSLLLKTPYDGNKPSQKTDGSEASFIGGYLFFAILVAIWGLLGYWLYKIARTNP